MSKQPDWSQAPRWAQWFVVKGFDGVGFWCECKPKKCQNSRLFESNLRSRSAGRGFEYTGQPISRLTFDESRIDNIGQNGGDGEHYAMRQCGRHSTAYNPERHDECPRCVEDEAGKSNSVRSKYHREIKPGVFVDVYDVLVAFGVTNPADAHAIKKMLAPGQRGAKDGIQERREAIASLVRAIEIEGGDK